MKAWWRGKQADEGEGSPEIQNLSPALPFRTSEWLGSWQGVGGVGGGWFHIPARQGTFPTPVGTGEGECITGWDFGS